VAKYEGGSESDELLAREAFLMLVTEAFLFEKSPNEEPG
jgi:hypothetical protein